MALTGGLIFLDDFSTEDVGRHQVGRELDSAEFETDRIGQRLDQQRLRKSRHPPQQTVSARKQRKEHFTPHLVLANDDASDFCIKPFGERDGCIKLCSRINHVSSEWSGRNPIIRSRQNPR